MGELSTGPHQTRRVGRSALHIGRVGGLAVALGIGAAVLTGQAVASADTDGSSGSTGSSAARHDSAADPRAGRDATDTAAGAASTTGADRRAAARAQREERATERATARAERTAARAERSAARADRIEQRRERTVRLTPPPATDPTATATTTEPPAPRPRAAGLLTLAASSLVGAGETTASPSAAATDRTVVASGLNSPTDFQFLPDGRILVAEKGGRIRVIDDGTLVTRPLYRIPVLTQGERGLGGLAVDPDFADNGYIYVAYTTLGARDRLARLTVKGNRVVWGSQKILLQSTDRSAFFHHGGALGFAPDGTLYWGVGDNKNSANAQDLGTIHGKIIRINPDGTVPSDNPDLGAGALPQVYAYGFRNPFRLTFTPTGELLVADVGENSFEELNLVTAGGNYGWPGAEGTCANCGSINPIYTYAHNGNSAAITSVLVYTGGQLGPEYQGKVFIADEVQGWIKVLTCTAGYTSCGDPQDFDLQAGTTVTLAQGPDGALYQLTYQPGELVRITAPTTVV